MNTTVNFEIAKLLKEKRYDKPCLKCYLEDGSVQISSGDEGDFEEYNHNRGGNYSAPTIAEVVMWVYEKYGIWISVGNIDDSTVFRHCFSNIDFNSPTEAYEAAITYTLTKLI